MGPRASLPKPLQVGQQRGWGKATKDSVPALKAVSLTGKPPWQHRCTQKNMNCRSDSLNHMASQPSYVSRVSRQPRMDGPAWHPSQEWSSLPSAVTQRGWGPCVHVRACNLAGKTVAATAAAFLRPESISKNVNWWPTLKKYFFKLNIRIAGFS